MLRLATPIYEGTAQLHKEKNGVGLALDTGRCLYAAQFGRPVRAHPDIDQFHGRIDFLKTLEAARGWQKKEQK